MAGRTEWAFSLHPSTISWRIPWPGLAYLAAEIGYKGAVIPRDQPLPVDLIEAPVTATAMQLPVEVRQDESAFVQTFPRLRCACKFATQMGCEVALLGVPSSSEQPRGEQARTYRERLKRCCDVLDEYSIRLALECITPLHSRQAYPYEFIWHNDEMLEFGLTLSPNVGLIIDSWHWHHAGSDPKWIVDIPAERILDVHLSDSPQARPEEIRDSQRLVPGEGVIDLKLFFELLEAKGYARPVALEIFGGLRDLAPSDAALTAFNACGRLFSETGRKI
jgi:sugar phosphate isomerase/epimerase